MSHRADIAIDCDDVLVHASEYLVDTYNGLYGTNVKLAHAHQSNNNEWEADRDEVFRRLTAIQQSAEFAAISPLEQTITAVHRLARQHELHLVTARLDAVMPVTNQMIETYFAGCFESIEHVGPDRAKGDVCQLIRADVMIDDNYHHLESAHASGVGKLIWFGNYPWQRDVENGAIDIVRCSDWLHVEKELEKYA